ncbi:T9SS type A sorting domain-containing protein [bacterium]|nr:T9SS type A sorting domain-containing protein [bacterium]
MKINLNIIKKQTMVAKMFILTGLLIFAMNVFAQDPNFYIYLCFGQSNMEGQGTIESQDRIVDDRFKVFQALNCSNLGRTKAKWYTAVPPTCQCWSRLSPADYFGRTMVANLPDSVTIGIINVSIGGCDIRLFDKDIYQDYDSTYTESWFTDKIRDYEGNPYQYLVNLAQLAQQDGVIKGILLHQGETNTGQTLWPSYVKKIYNDMLTDLSLSAESVPLLAGEVLSDEGNCCSSMNSIINKLPDAIPTAYVISSSGCTGQDEAHFDSEGYREFGRRYAAQMLSLMGIELTGIEDSAVAPDGYVLEQNYPNPFNPHTKISYRTLKAGLVTIDVYNNLGQKIKTLVNSHHSAGEFTAEWDGSDDFGNQVTTGTYFFKLSIDGENQAKKMLFLK